MQTRTGRVRELLALQRDNGTKSCALSCGVKGENCVGFSGRVQDCGFVVYVRPSSRASPLPQVGLLSQILCPLKIPVGAGLPAMAAV